jgi:hypothetical protein
VKTLKQLDEILKVKFLGDGDKARSEAHNPNVLDITRKIHDTPGISTAQHETINNYTHFGYRHINESLRSGDGWHKAEGDQIDKAIRKHSVKEDTHVHRIFDSGVTNMLDGAEPGDTVRDKGIVSTTLDGNVKFLNKGSSRHHIAKIKIPKGSHALALNNYKGLSQYPHEHEVLLPPGSKFKYRRKQVYKNFIIHHLDHIPEPHKTIVPPKYDSTEDDELLRQLKE